MRTITTYFPDPGFAAGHYFRQSIAKGQKSKCLSCRNEMAARFVTDYGVSDYDARLLTASRAQAAYFEEAPKPAAKVN